MVEITGKIIKLGHSYYFNVPTKLIDCKVLPPGEEITLKVTTDLSTKMGCLFNMVNTPSFDFVSY